MRRASMNTRMLLSALLGLILATVPANWVSPKPNDVFERS